MKAQVIINKNFRHADIDRRIYGSHAEHFGRLIYNGIYEPTHPTADDCGFRRDVIDLVKKLGVSVVRYPGGGFAQEYNWEDMVGDKSKRPRSLQLSWRRTETHEFGIDEVQEWGKRVNSDILMAVNLSTRGPVDAKNLVEYCNLETNTRYANMRRANGFEKPFGFKYWCLGNEIDGPWALCSKNAEEYSRIATETAKVMKWTDPSIELMLCGSSNPDVPHYVNYDLKVLDAAYEHIDYLSLHQYYDNVGNDPGYSVKNDSADYLSRNLDLDRSIKSSVAMCDIIKAKKRSKKTVNISFDEWGVWKTQGRGEEWSIAPHQLEDVYNLEDALVIGLMMMTLQKNCDRVKVACLAQLVNSLAPIMTENGGKSWVQTTFYPFMYASKYGNGTVLKSVVNCDSYPTKMRGDVPYIELIAIDNADARELVIYAVNRSLEDSAELDLHIEDFGDVKLVEHIELYHDDLLATNEKDAERVYPRSVEPSDVPTLKKHSWNMLRYSY